MLMEDPAQVVHCENRNTIRNLEMYSWIINSPQCCSAVIGTKLKADMKWDITNIKTEP